MRATTSMLLDLLDTIDDEIRKVLQEVIDERQEVDPGTLADLVTAAVAERLHPRPQPSIAALRRQIRELFDPSIFDDDEGPDPLAAIAAIRGAIAKGG